MHRLRKGKKGNKEEEDGVPPIPQPTTTTSHNPFKWGRTPEPPPKPQIDLENALPPSDDFRTSLLMPNLTQRFSILQMEMAAAAAAAGKANGENFILPNDAAAGGMEGFVFTNPQFTPLGDITETSSLAESGTTVQQNRLTTKSEESLVSDESGGIMNRARGGEGNVLFGGRQKVYRVPNAYTSSKDSAEDSNPGSPMGGKTVGSYDLPEAAFTSPKQRREQDLEEASSPSGGDTDGYNKNRNTSSSTNSTPTTITRSSTAATSVTSNKTPSGSIPTSASTSSLPIASGPMVANKPRRALYEQALDQQLQDQQSTAVGRLERLASLRKASASPPPANSYQGSFSPPQPAQQPITSPSSPVSPQQPPQWSLNIRKSPDSPMSTAEEDEDEDNGEKVEKQEYKASGPGLSPHMAQFNFGLEPRSQSPISPPVSASAIQFPTQGPFSPGNLPRDQQQRNQSSEKLNLQLEQKRMPSPLSDISDQHGQNRKTFLSMRSSITDSSYGEPEGSEIGMMDDESKPVFRNSLDHIAPLHPRKQSGPSSADSAFDPLEPVSPVSPVSPISPIFSNSRSSDDLIRGVQPLRNPAISPTSPQFSSDTNALSDDDSPTLPPGQGLSMLVRQHLRTDSSHSSVYAGSTYTRMSRTSHYGTGASKGPKTPGVARPSVSGASGSSGGNLWEFDDWDGGYYAEDDNNGPHSPSTISDAAPAPSIPTKASNRARSEERRDDEELARERERGRADSRMSDRDRAMSRASDRERSIPAGDDEHDKDWEQQLAFRRQIIQQNLRNHEKVNSQHEMNFPSENFKDQQPKNGGSGGGFGVLRSKASNGILSKNDPSVKPPRNGRDSPGPGMRKDGGRSRMNSHEADRRAEEERRLRETVRGPKNIPSGNYPMQQHPPHSHHHIPPPNSRNGPGHLNTNQSPELRPPQKSPIGLPHPLHSPMHTPRPKQRPSREQMNSGQNNGQNTTRGQPMGWRDERDNYGTPRSAPGTQPGSPVSQRDGHGPRKQPSMPRMNGPEMHRPGQGQLRDQDPRQGRHGGPPPGAQMNHGPMNHGPMNNGPMNNGLNKKQSFDQDVPPPSSDFRRPRGSSNASSGPTMRQRRGTFDGTPLPPLNTTALAPPTPQHLQSASTPGSAVTIEKSPAFSQMQRTLTNSSAVTTPASAIPPKVPPAVLMQTIANSNAGFVPAKKRVVDKSKIGDPKLISSSSKIPTVDLPVQSPASLSGKDKDGRKRRMTETRGIFSGFGKNKSTEEVPAIPTGSPMMQRHHTDDEVERSSFTDDPPPKKKVGGKLRKSTSDGGALSARARKDAMARSPTVPKISKAMGGPPAGMI